MARSFEHRGRKVRKNGSRLQKELALAFFLKAYSAIYIFLSSYQALGILELSN